MSEATGFVSGVMADIISRANAILRERVTEFREWIVYELKVYATECAWMKSRGMEPSELNIQDVENAIIIEDHPGDNGLIGWVLRIKAEFLELLESGQASALHNVMYNARKREGLHG